MALRGAGFPQHGAGQSERGSSAAAAAPAGPERAGWGGRWLLCAELCSPSGKVRRCSRAPATLALSPRCRAPAGPCPFTAAGAAPLRGGAPLGAPPAGPRAARASRAVWRHCAAPAVPRCRHGRHGGPVRQRRGLGARAQRSAVFLSLCLPPSVRAAPAVASAAHPASLLPRPPREGGSGAIGAEPRAGGSVPAGEVVRLQPSSGNTVEYLV